MKTRNWLAEEHPAYTAWKEVWKREERRLRGGHLVMDELVPFDWEEIRDEDTAIEANLRRMSYKARQAQATYINFPDMHAAIVSGHLMREAPAPGAGLDFGTLGDAYDVNGAAPSRASMVYGNVDGAGIEGSQWDPWWMAATRRAMATGHRWVFVEGTPGGTPSNQRDEMNGLRPYCTELGPLTVHQWHVQNGILQTAIMRTSVRTLVVDPDTKKLKGGGKAEPMYLLLTRPGFTGWDIGSDNFSRGGWWYFNKDGEHVLRGPAREEWQGEFLSTRGELPLVPLYYERDTGVEGHPAISRPGLQGLSQVAISYMNLASAADYDAWDAGQSIMYLLGVDPKQHEQVLKQWHGGTKLVGVPVHTDDQGKVHVPTLTDGSSGAVTAEVFDRRLTTKWDQARTMAAMESTGNPNTSGTSKQMTFADVMAPRLANLAANVESSQTAVIRFLEMRFGGPTTRPRGGAVWPREFNLKDVVQDISTMFNLEAGLGVRNPEFDAGMLVRAAEELGLLANEEDRERFMGTWRDAISQANNNEAQASALLALAGQEA